MDTKLTPAVLTKILSNLPMGVIVFQNDKIHWVNSWLLKRLQTSLDKIVDLSKTQSAESDFAALFGDDEILHLTNSNEQAHWLHRQKSSTDDYEIHYFQEITSLMQVIKERDQLRSKAAAQQTKDPVTGLLNRQAILQALELQVSRSRRYQNPLSVIELSISTKTGKPCNEKQLKATSNLLKEQLRWADQVGFLGENNFLIVLPETSRTEAQRLIDKLCNTEESLLTKNSEIIPTFALEEWTKGDDPRKLLKRLKKSNTGQNSAL